MEKQTLSNYGWIVVVTLVLSVMLALATPFGTYVGDGVVSVANGFVGASDNAIDDDNIANLQNRWDEKLNADQSFDDASGGNDDSENTTYIVPEGGTYYVGVTSTSLGDYTGATATYTAGQNIPSTVSVGDVFVYGDYEYKYNYYYDSVGWTENTSQNGWGVRVLDDTKTEYGAILESINTQPVTTMENTFYYCTLLKTAPAIPSSVTNMTLTFSKCHALTGNIEINATPTQYDGCFYGTQRPITLSGTSTKLAEIAATAYNDNVTY